MARRLPSAAVAAALGEVIAVRGLPHVIQVDNGRAFTSNHFDAWAYLRETHIDFVGPGKPVENAFIESFNGRLTKGGSGTATWNRNWGRFRAEKA